MKAEVLFTWKAHLSTFWGHLCSINDLQANDKVKILDISVLFEEGMGRGAQSFFIQLTCYNLILTFFIQTLRQ